MRRWVTVGFAAVVFAVVFSVQPTLAQKGPGPRDEVKKLEAELDKLRGQLREMEARLKKLQGGEKSSSEREEWKKKFDQKKGPFGPPWAFDKEKMEEFKKKFEEMKKKGQFGPPPWGFDKAKMEEWKKKFEEMAKDKGKGGPPGFARKGPPPWAGKGPREGSIERRIDHIIAELEALRKEIKSRK